MSGKFSIQSMIGSLHWARRSHWLDGTHDKASWT